jgi:oxalate decarboxylase/phosphoglucose isomerase-like protein (cupin superfamily)
MDIEFSGDPFENQSPEATVVRFEDLRPTRHEASPIGADTDYLSWEYGYDSSRWFDDGGLLKLEPGEYTDFQSHRESVEGPYEKCLTVFSGRGVLRTERADEPLERFDSVLLPPSTAYQLGNTGTDTLWLGWWASVGDHEHAEASALEPVDRPGAREEYERIHAARSERGLATPPDRGAYEGDPDDGRPEPSISRFAETRPKMFIATPEIAATDDRPDWIYAFPDSNWISQSVVIRLDPGSYIGFHGHFENEGPTEEIYWVLNGEARLQTEYRDVTMRQFDCAFFPTGCMHTVGNTGTERVWMAAWVSKGGKEGEFDIDELETSERPRIREEFRRAMAARKQRGLPLPPDIEVSLE